jgi:hypothetical protein
MARVGRLAGAILAETKGEYFLVGNTKSPCDWAKAGFEPPVAIDALARPYLRLARAGVVTLAAPWLELELEGEALAAALAERFLIERNGSVSDRLWRLVVQRGDPDAPPSEASPADAIDARWLGEMPAGIWKIVRDTVLRCV